MLQYPNSLEIQKQNELRKISDAQNRLAMIEQQAQMQAQQQNQYMNFSQPQPQFLGINGKVVQSVDNITANDVPMDGSFAVFPKQDMSEIYIKAWNPNGNINTTVYRPVEPISDGQADNSMQTDEKLKFDAFNEVLEGISAKVDTLTSRLDEFIGKPKTSTRTKKETETND